MSKHDTYINDLIKKYNMKCQEWNLKFFGYDENGKEITIEYGVKLNSKGNRENYTKIQRH